MKIEKYYENPSALHINTEDDRAYFIPYAKEKNDRMILLSGNDWKFQWYSDYLKIPESAKDGILDQYDVIDVPSCVNMLGYEIINMQMFECQFHSIPLSFQEKIHAEFM